MEKQTDKLGEMKNWLLSTFSKIKVLDELYLIGSILNHQSNNYNDIDIVQKINFQSKTELKSYGVRVEEIKKDFIKKFNTPLHITTFTQNELKDFKEFMKKNIYIKLL